MLRDVLILKGLSFRESEVAVLVSKGWRNKEVAKELFIEEKTVKFHLTNIYKKLHIKSRAQLVVWSAPHMTFEENSSAQKSWKEEPEVTIEAPDYILSPGLNKIGNA